jgi:hypothetical protein
MLIETLLCPTVSITSDSVGFAASLTGTSAAVPVTAPVGSGPFGAAAAVAGVASAGAAGGSWARAPTARSANTPRARATPSAKLRVSFRPLSLMISTSLVRNSRVRSAAPGVWPNPRGRPNQALSSTGAPADEPDPPKL